MSFFGGKDTYSGDGCFNFRGKRRGNDFLSKKLDGFSLRKTEKAPYS